MCVHPFCLFVPDSPFASARPATGQNVAPGIASRKRSDPCMCGLTAPRRCCFPDRQPTRQPTSPNRLPFQADHPSCMPHASCVTRETYLSKSRARTKKGRNLIFDSQLQTSSSLWRSLECYQWVGFSRVAYGCVVFVREDHGMVALWVARGHPQARQACPHGPERASHLRGKGGGASTGLTVFVYYHTLVQAAIHHGLSA